MELLVSVRNAIEAAIVASHRVTVIDIKEPANGSLGIPEPTVVTEILNQLPIDQTVSLALGELADLSPEKVRIFFSRAKMPQASIYAKIGLAGMTKDTNWQSKWEEILKALPDVTAPVTVAYADYKLANAPPIEEVMEAGSRLGCRAFLLDTYSKSNGSSLDHVKLDELQRLAKRASANQMKFVLAGSISSNDLGTLRDLNIDMIGVRGAVCEAAVRTSSISDSRLAKFIVELSDFSNRERAHV